jgi:hypothetical protein
VTPSLSHLPANLVSLPAAITGVSTFFDETVYADPVDRAV